MSIRISTLTNGLRIVTDSIEHVETVTLGVWARIGARYEDAQINGISHFLEHMAFKGTEQRTAQQIAEEIESVGGYLNAYTSREMTAYHARVLASDVPLALNILADILLNSTFQEEEFRKEQNVIIQEILEAIDTPDDIIFDYFQETAFPQQSLGRPILGTPEIIKNLTPHAVKEYMQQNYSPERLVLAAAGKIDHEAFVEQANECFAKCGHASSHAKKATKAHYQGGVRCVVKPLEQTHWLIGFEGVSQTDPHFYHFAVLSTLLGGGMSSRLFQEAREKKGLAYTIYSYHSSYQDTGIFGIYASTTPEDVLTLTSLVQEELKKVTHELTASEVNRAKAQMKAGTLMGLENTTTRCERAANHLHLFNRVLTLQETIQKIDSVTLEEIQAIAKKTFSSSPTFTTLGPKNYEEDLKALEKLGLA